MGWKKKVEAIVTEMLPPKMVMIFTNTSGRKITKKRPCYFMPERGGIRGGSWKENGIKRNSHLFAGVSEEEILPGRQGEVLIKGQIG